MSGAGLEDLTYYATTSGGPEARSFALAGAVTGAMGGAVLVARPGEIVPEVRVLLFWRPDLVHPAAELDGAMGITFQARRAALGDGTIVLGNEDDDLALIWDHECAIRYEIAGRAAFTMLVNDIEHVAIAAGEEVDEVTTLKGDAHISALAEAVVYPALGPDRLPFADDRLFSWASLDFEDRRWTPAAVMAIASAVPPGNEGWWESTEFPDPNAAWIWAPGSTATLAPGGGSCYFRCNFETHEPFSLRVFATIDNGGNLFFDGAPLIMDMGDFTQIYTADIDVSPGLHTIAVEGVNETRAPGDTTLNPAGLIVSVATIDPNGETAGVLLNTAGGGWVGVYYPPQPPGFTPGEVIRHVVEEAQGRGCYPEIAFAFTDQVDSAGVPWPTVNDISTKIGTDTWVFIGEELAATYVDVWMAPGDFTLYAWAHGTQGRPRDVTLHGVTDEHDPLSGNLAGLTHRIAR